MAVRTTMQDLIDLFREKGNASTSDLFDGVTYWSDEQLQDILDESSKFVQIPIVATDTGNTIFRLETFAYKKLEDGFEVYDENESLVSDTVTYDLKKNYLTFDAEQTVATYIEGWQYDLYDALVELYDRKAAQREFYTRMKAGNNTLHLEQEYHQCVARRDYYLNKKIRRADRKQGGKWRI